MSFLAENRQGGSAVAAGLVSLETWAFRRQSTERGGWLSEDVFARPVEAAARNDLRAQIADATADRRLAPAVGAPAYVYGGTAAGLRPLRRNDSPGPGRGSQSRLSSPARRMRPRCQPSTR